MTLADSTAVHGRGRGRLSLAVLMLLKVSLCNLVAAATPRRLAEIASFLQNDVVVLIGTGSLAGDGRPVQKKTDNETIEGIVVGWQRVGFVNKLSGITFHLRKKWRSVFNGPPPSLAVRLAAIRLRGECSDYLAIAAYVDMSPVLT